MKKILSLLLILSFFVFGLSFAEVDLMASISESDKHIYSGYGFTLQNPEENITDNVKTITAPLTSANENIEAKIVVVYDKLDDTWLARGSELSFVYKDAKGKAFYTKALQNLLNHNFEDGEHNDFYKAALAFCIASENDLNEASAKMVLHQIFVQQEIANFHAHTAMTSFAQHKLGDEVYDEGIDQKSPIFNGKKFLLTVQDNGYIFSIRPTDESNTIELNQTQNLKINKQFAWDEMQNLLQTALPTYSQSASGMLSIEDSELKDGEAQLFITGEGVLLAVGKVHLAFLPPQATSENTMKALSVAVKNFNTLNRYAQMAGCETFIVNAYFEHGKTPYTANNIHELSDLLSGFLKEPVLLGEDEAKLPMEENLSDIVVKETLSEPQGIDISLTTTTDDAAPQSTTPSDEPNFDMASDVEHSEDATENNNQNISDASTPKGTQQAEVVKKKVNLRETPGGTIVFKVYRKNVLTVTGEPQKENGFTWYPIQFNDKAGYIRSDTIKLLDYVIEQPTETEVSAESVGAYVPLSRGKTGAKVLDLQIRLMELGYFDGTVDGKYGGKTEEAVKTAQKAFHLQQSGVADEAFQSMLFAENAITEQQSSMARLDPNNMQADTKVLEDALKYMQSKWAKTQNGYTAGFALQNDGLRYTLRANVVDNKANNFEVFIAANSAQGALNINPQFEMRFINPNVQNVSRVLLVRGNKELELPTELWQLDRGVVRMDLTHNPDALNLMLEHKGEMVFEGETSSFKISLNAKELPYIVARQMKDVWKNFNGETLAQSYDFAQNEQMEP